MRQAEQRLCTQQELGWPVCWPRPKGLATDDISSTPGVGVSAIGVGNAVAIARHRMHGSVRHCIDGNVTETNLWFVRSTAITPSSFRRFVYGGRRTWAVFCQRASNACLWAAGRL